MVEEAYRFLGKAGDVNECLELGGTVDERVGNEVCSLLRVEDVHCCKGAVALLHADNLLGNLDGIGILCIKTCHESIGIACLDHHHAEVVALEHLVIGLLECITLALTLVGKDMCITLAALALIRMTQVDNLDAFKVQAILGRYIGDNLIVTQKYRMTYALFLGLYGSLHH